MIICLANSPHSFINSFIFYNPSEGVHGKQVQVPHSGIVDYLAMQLAAGAIVDFPVLP